MKVLSDKTVITEGTNRLLTFDFFPTTCIMWNHPYKGLNLWPLQWKQGLNHCITRGVLTILDNHWKSLFENINQKNSIYYY